MFDMGGSNQGLMLFYHDGGRVDYGLGFSWRESVPVTITSLGLKKDVVV